MAPASYFLFSVFDKINVKKLHETQDESFSLTLLKSSFSGFLLLFIGELATAAWTTTHLLVSHIFDLNIINDNEILNQIYIFFIKSLKFSI